MAKSATENQELIDALSDGARDVFDVGREYFFVLTTVIHTGATGFIGNDVQMARVPAIDVLLLDR